MPRGHEVGHPDPSPSTKLRAQVQKKGAEVQLSDANPREKASPWFLEVPGLILGQFYPKPFYPCTIFNLSDFFAAPVPRRDLVSAPHMIITKYFNLFFTFLVFYVCTACRSSAVTT